MQEDKDSGPEQSAISVRVVTTYDVGIGDTIWAPDDGDWLLVHDIQDNGYGDVTFRRRDYSVADFPSGQRLLLRAAGGFFAGTAYTVLGRPIEVRADRASGTVELDVDGSRHMLNLGHLEQLDSAIRRALIWMAIGGSRS